MQQQGYISFGGTQLHYEQWGKGQRLLLAFHGYGNDAGLFRQLALMLADDYIVISVDLPHHGGSNWHAGTPFIKQDLELMVHELMQKFGADTLTLAGYSLGGRVCLNIVELLPGYIEQVLLIAPDGLAPNKFYYFVTHTGTGKRMFRSFLEGNNGYHKVVDWLHSARMLDASRHKFLMHYLSTQESRAFILKVWPDMRLLLPDLKAVKKHIAAYGIPVNIFMGRYDRIIPVKLARRFAKGMDTVQVHVLEKGHRMFDMGSLSGMVNILRRS